MLAPPALYIPRHCRGTPFERGRCRRDACMVLCILNPATSTLIILKHRQTNCYRESPLERGTAKPWGMYRKANAKSTYLKRTFAIYAGSASVIHTRHCRGTPFERGRCRRDACMVMYISNAVAPQHPLEVLTIFLPALLPFHYPLTT